MGMGGFLHIIFNYISFTSSMASALLQFSFLLLLCFHCFIIDIVSASSSSSSSNDQSPKAYVVYMGSTSSSIGEEDGVEVDQFAELAHLKLLSSIIPSEESVRVSLIHHYKNAFKGFSALLTPKEASVLSGHEDIVSVFPDPILQLHTTRSWDFLEAQAQPKHHIYHNVSSSSDVIIGIIDTGIWPESPSFTDKRISEIPSKWKGVCMESPDFKKSNCNRKLIGARYYSKSTNSLHKGSSRDSVGHGTHTSSIAAGVFVQNASYFGLARGTARGGGSPSTRIASYKACTEDGCSGSAILKAIDDAIHDGVDLISISIGMSSVFQSDYLSDPIAIGAFHAEELGVMVVCSAGNDGPDFSSVVNTAPWIFTVAASSIDRDFQSTIVLGNGKAFNGSGINFSNLSPSKTYPLAFGKDVAAKFTPESEARSCYPGSLDPEKVKGKVIVCVANDPIVSRKTKKLVVEDGGAKGLILIDEDEKGVPFDSGVFPFSEVGTIEGIEIVNYINSTKNPTATILPTVDFPRYKPAPVIAYFSSRGPGGLTENILKPDITAPGVGILAAVIPKATTPGSVPIGQKPSRYAIKSGTSMACPHVTGAAAFIKSVHWSWTSSMIRSTLMTTAMVYDNMGKPLTINSGSYANPHDMGVGEINPIKALNPGLVFETSTEDYLRFLCYFGYTEKNVRSMTSNTKFNCPKNSFDKLISNVNYPSISISKLDRHSKGRVIERTVTNVGSSNATYIARVQAPSGLLVSVLPKKIVFSERVTRVSFKVSFHVKEASSGYNYGSVTWSDGSQHSVRLVFTVNVE